MSIIMDIISVIGSGVSISGITLKDLVKKNPNKVEIERYIKFLEPKKVLTAPLDEGNYLCSYKKHGRNKRKRRKMLG